MQMYKITNELHIRVCECSSVFFFLDLDIFVICPFDIAIFSAKGISLSVLPYSNLRS